MKSASPNLLDVAFLSEFGQGFGRNLATMMAVRAVAPILKGSLDSIPEESLRYAVENSVNLVDLVSKEAMEEVKSSVAMYVPLMDTLVGDETILVLLQTVLPKKMEFLAAVGGGQEWAVQQARSILLYLAS